MLETNIDRWEAHAIAKGLQQGVQQGVQQGIKQGIEQGLLEGEVQSLQRLLNRRFGSIPDALAARIAAASQTQIKSWFDAAIDAPNLASIFEPTRH